MNSGRQSCIRSLRGCCSSLCNTVKRKQSTCTSANSDRYRVHLNSQITFHGRNGNLKAARSIFNQMPFKDVFTWTALLTAYVDNGQIVLARKVFDEMPRRNLTSWNAMFTGYIREGRLTEAFELFSRMPIKNEVSYGAMISGFAKSGLMSDAEAVYNETPQVLRDPVASNALMNGYLRSSDFEKAIILFERMVVKDVFSWSSMVDGLCKFGRILDARKVFDAMPEKNVVSWTAMIRGYMKAGKLSDGFFLLADMRRDGVRVNSTTMSVILDSCSEFSRYDEGIQLHGLIFKMGFDSDIFLSNSLIITYVRGGCMNAARRVFDSMRKKDLVTWNSIISGYVQHDLIEDAYELFQVMPDKDAISWTTMLVGFCNRGLTNEAMGLFTEMPEKDDVAWTAVITGLRDNGEHVGAFHLFKHMVREGIGPNPLLLSCLLSASADSTIINQGTQVHCFVVKMTLELDILIQTSLLSMYAKCGNLVDANRVFSSIDQPTLVCMNAIMTAFAQHGLAHEALGFFKDLIAKGLKPNKVSFLGVLSACARSGLVEEGYTYFRLMSSSYGVDPDLDHCTCMVDLLGRAGLLNEAVQLVNSMPFRPSTDIWGALLNASKMHSDLRLAKLASQRLIELDPHNAAAYSVLSDMYCLAGFKKDGEEIRLEKKSQGMVKNPGCSWIVLENNLRKTKIVAHEG